MAFPFLHKAFGQGQAAVGRPAVARRLADHGFAEDSPHPHLIARPGDLMFKIVHVHKGGHPCQKHLSCAVARRPVHKLLCHGLIFQGK